MANESGRETDMSITARSNVPIKEQRVTTIDFSKKQDDPEDDDIFEALIQKHGVGNGNQHD